ncbi:MAG: ATP-binding cassette domain-containing protein, partial [Nitrososphaerota archaeon]|nr:ATP-binding cassette domain-containing protein [Nitrososphaerota archaeon]
MREVLCDISSEFESGSLHAIFGHSGSGKTTLINIIAGLDRPDGGEVWMGDRRLDTLGPAELA